MSFSKIATMAEIRTHLIDNTAPTAALAERAGHMAADPQQHHHLVRICDGRYIGGASFYQRSTEFLSGAQQVGILTVAALCALNGGNPGLAATAITRLEVLANRHHLEVSPIVDILKIDHRIAVHLHVPA
jgi:hypothetical protein